MNSYILFLLSLSIGYFLFLVFSHPNKKKHSLPRVRYKNIELLPNFKIHFRTRTYHLHHWLLLSILTVGTLYVFDSFQHLMFVKGVAIGGIIQGLRYPDRFKFSHPRFPKARFTRL